MPTENTPETVTVDPALAPIEGLILEGGEFGDAMAFSAVKMPPKRNGLPCHYFYKESLLPGTFQDNNKKVWTITPKDIADAKSDLDRALLLGHEPPIQNDHKNPTKSFGFIKGARVNERGGLELLHQFMGDAERDEALRRKTSIMLLPKHEDAKFNRFNWFTDHSAVVFRPQLTDLKDYQPLAASGQPVNASYITLSQGDPTMDLATISAPFRLALGDSAKDKSDADILALAAASISAQPKLPDGLSIKTLRDSLGDTAKNATDAQIPMLALAAHYEGNQVLIGQLSAAESERDHAKSALALAGQQQVEEETNPTILALSGKLADMAIATALLPSPQHGNRPVISDKQAAWLRAKAKASPALALSADAATLATPIDDFIEFAKLGASTAVAPLKRGEVPSGIVPAAPLALSGEQVETPMTDAEKAKFLALIP